MKVDGITLLQKYKNKKIDKTTLLFYNDTLNSLVDVLDDMVIDELLETEFEIIEEDKPIQKLNTKYTCSDLDFEIINKINELIDRVNGGNKDV